MNSKIKVITPNTNLSPPTPSINGHQSPQSGRRSNNDSLANDDDRLVNKNSHLRGHGAPPKIRFSKEERPPKLSIDASSFVFAPTLQKKLASTMSSRFVEVFGLGLVIFYIALEVVNILIDQDCETDSAVRNASKVLIWIELAFLAIFILEILLKVSVLGIKDFLHDLWLAIDLLVVMILTGLLVFYLCDSKGDAEVGRIRGLFRFFRIFLLLRKANDFSLTQKRKVTVSAQVGLKSPVEKVLELCERLKASTKDKVLKQEIEWAMEVVSTNKLYDPLLGEEHDPLNVVKQDVSLWFKSYKNEQPQEVEGNPSIVGALTRSVSGMPAFGGKYKVASSIIMKEEAAEYLKKNINELSFDLFTYKRMNVNDELASIMFFLFESHDFFENLNITQETFIRFAKKIQSGYPDNAFHNASHAADVLQTVNYFLTTGEFSAKAELNNLEVASMLIAAAIHDYDHPGTNNAFQINTRSPIAIKYNDKAVLENHHVSSVFSFMQQENYNIFANLSKEDYKLIREMIIAMVLATDMSVHFGDIAKLKGRLAADIDIKGKDKRFLMEMVVHASDVSNPSKPWDLCKEWSIRVVSEFFDQGDKERDLGLPISHLCDKYTTNLAKSQIGFIDFVVFPLFGLMKEVLPKLDITGFDTNKSKWKELVDHYEDELKELNARREAEEKEIEPHF